MKKEVRRLRCAIYTRVSTEHGLEQDFNSLDAQREAAEAYIKSQAHEGWVLVKAHYDGGLALAGDLLAGLGFAALSLPRGLRSQEHYGGCDRYIQTDICWEVTMRALAFDLESFHPRTVMNLLLRPW
jgi:hypothetical protein